MIAFQGIIEKSSAKGSTKAKPHDGFILTLKISKVFKGTNLGSTVNVIYGPCHNMPGAIGEKINVLALPEKAGGWYAPQFWTTQKVTPQK